MEGEYLQFAEKLKALTADRAITNRRLANELGVSVTMITKWKQGEAMPRLDKLPRLAEALGVTINDLFGDEGKPPDDCKPLYNFADIAPCLDGRKDYCKTCRMITCRLVRHNQMACSSCINQNTCMLCRIEKRTDYRINHKIKNNGRK